MGYRIALVVLSMIICFSSAGQDEENDSNKVAYSIVPLVYFLPETGLGYGVGGVASFKWGGSVNASQVQLAASYTTLDQILIFIPYRLFWKNDKYLAYGELGYYRFTYQYFGNGIDARSTDEELFDVTFPRLRASFLYEIFPGLYLGGRYWYDDFRITSVAAEGILDTQNIVGNRGGEVAGLGFVMNYDTRDNQLYPSKGWFIEGVLLPHLSYYNSDFEFFKVSLDASWYWNFYKKHILAFNTYLESNFGNTPFNQLAFLGGPKRLRGFYEGRFRDNHAAVLQAEYRWMFYKRFGLAAFTSLGNVSSTILGYDFAKTKLTFGGGLRFQVTRDEKVNLRLDAGVAEDGLVNFYITFAEAF